MTRTSPYPPATITLPDEDESNLNNTKRAPQARLAHVPGEAPPTVKQQVLRFCSVLVVDIILPVAVYFVLKIWLAPVWALLIGGVPALISVIVKGIWKRSADIAGLLVFVAFAISAVVAATTNNARLLVMEKALVTSVLGLVFVLTLIPVRVTWKGRKRVLRPVIFYMIRQMVPMGAVMVVPVGDGEASVESEGGRDPEGTEAGRRDVVGSDAPQSVPYLNHQSSSTTLHSSSSSSISSHLDSSGQPTDKWNVLWRSSHRIRFDFRFLTALWGILLLVEFAGRLAMVLITAISIDDLVLFANIFFGVVLVVGVVVTVWYGWGMKRRVHEEVARWGLVESEELNVGDDRNV
ncbi:hypothetical protein HDV00_004453 [Rhizophlyctis rosea]|nr:hypothetical protein HDV00_004453 [Rhizophlyctis rosea]